jgi:hypothetical protein
MSLVYCENCQDRGVIKLRKFSAPVFRSAWCSCPKGQRLKKESERDMYDED